MCQWSCWRNTHVATHKHANESLNVLHTPENKEEPRNPDVKPVWVLDAYICEIRTKKGGKTHPYALHTVVLLHAHIEALTFDTNALAKAHQVA